MLNRLFNVKLSFFPAKLVYNMKCGDNEQCSTSKVQRQTTKQEQIKQIKHGPLQKLEVGSGVIEEGILC